MIKFLSLLMLLLFAQSSFAQTSTLKGTIIDKKTQEPLPFASVTLINETDQATTSTDFDGRFQFDTLAGGSYTLECSYVSFGSKKIELTLLADSTQHLIIELEEHVLTEEIIVRSYSIKGKKARIRDRRAKRSRKSANHSRRRIWPPFSRSEYANKRHRSPRTSNTEDYATIHENEFKDVQRAPLSTFSIDVDRASYANVRRFLNDHQRPTKDAVRIEELVNYFDYSYPQPTDNHPFSITTEASACPWNKDAKLLHIGLQGKRIALDNAAPNNLVFLLDVSGSMDYPDKLPLVKAALKLLIQNMRDEDRIAIVVYAGAAGLILPSTSGSERNKILAALERLSAGGSTAGGEGIELAYQIAQQHYLSDGNNRVILATDGDFNVGVSSDAGLERLIEKKRESNIFLSVLGFGTGNYKDNKMETLADKGNGNYAYIDNILEAKKTLGKEMGGTLYTIAKDVKIQVEFNPVFVHSYRLVGYENRLLNDEDFNNDKKDAGELGAGHTVTAIYEIIPTASTTKPAATTDALKYQTTVTTNAAQNSGEMLTVKLRYKQPKGIKSTLIKHPVAHAFVPLAETSDNYRFAAAVAGFGLLLRDSSFKQDLTYDEVLALAKQAKGSDEEGYRTEFIQLVEMAKLLPTEAKK